MKILSAVLSYDMWYILHRLTILEEKATRFFGNPKTAYRQSVTSQKTVVLENVQTAEQY